MSKSLLKTRVYDMRDWKKASRIERIYLYLMQPDFFDRYIVPRDLAYLEQLKEAYSVMRKELSQTTTIKLVREMFPDFKNDLRVYRLINDVKTLFGNLFESNKNFDRLVIREKFIQIAKKCFEDEDYENERKCYEAIVKLDGLDKHELETYDVSQFEFPAIEFTNDPKYLEEIDEAELIEDEEE